jgi:hypothetical protein
MKTECLSNKNEGTYKSLVVPIQFRLQARGLAKECESGEAQFAWLCALLGYGLGMPTKHIERAGKEFRTRNKVEINCTSRISPNPAETQANVGRQPHS